MTTNCIQSPTTAYKGRIFTTGLVGWPGVTHIAGNDFAPVIEAALELPGFAEDEPARSIMVGFGRNAVLGVADKVIEAVKGETDPALLPGRRLRRRQAGPELLHRVRRAGAQGLRRS